MHLVFRFPIRPIQAGPVWCLQPCTTALRWTIGNIYREGNAIIVFVQQLLAPSNTFGCESATASHFTDMVEYMKRFSQGIARWLCVLGSSLFPRGLTQFSAWHAGDEFIFLHVLPPEQHFSAGTLQPTNLQARSLQQPSPLTAHASNLHALEALWCRVPLGRDDEMSFNMERIV